MSEEIKFSNDLFNEIDNINSRKKIKAFFSRSISSHYKFLKNPSITKFNALNKFIYDLEEGANYIKSIRNANCIKLNENEKKFIEEKCKEIQALQDNNNGTKLIFIKQSI